MRLIDIIALVASIIAAITLAIFKVRKSRLKLRLVPVMLMFFGPATILIHMGFHTGQIAYQSIQSITNNTFTYTFRFYSLLLMPAVLVFCCAALLRELNLFLIIGRYKAVLKNMLAVFLTSAPTIPFTPIGSLPILACIITLVTMPFVIKANRKRYGEDVLKPEVKNCVALN